MATLEEKAKKRKIGEERYKIEQAGQEGELKARPVIRYLFKEEEQRQDKIANDFLNQLDMAASKGLWTGYIKVCCRALVAYLKEEDLEGEADWTVKYTKDGVVMFITVSGRLFQRAFKPVLDPKVDLNACKVFAASVGNLVSKMEGDKGSKLYTEAPKIYLPNGRTN